MDAQILNELIQNPEKATIEQALLVHELVVKYPYFQAARVLHLKLLALSDYPAFVKELPYVATYAGDRKKLYYYINPEKNKPQVEKEEKAEKPAEKHPVSKKLTAESTIKEEAGKEEVKEVEETPVQKAETKEEQLIRPEQPKSETHSFAQWLDNLATQAAPQSDPETTSQDTEFLAEEGAEIQDSVKQNNLDNGGLTDERWSLIDSFLREYKPAAPKSEPEVIPSNKTAIDLSEQRTDPGKEIITETLAEIFLAQKNYKKAIEIFEKLRLKYPEKNAYFADLIKKARKQRKKEHKNTK